MVCASQCACARTVGTYTCNVTYGLRLWDREGALMCECPWDKCSMGTAFTGSECPREGSPPALPASGPQPALAHLSGSAAAPPCGPAAGPCGRSNSAPGRGSTQSRPGPGDSCHGSLFFGEERALWGCRVEEVARSPPQNCLRPTHAPPKRGALTAVNAAHSPLQLGVAAGGAPGAVHIHVRAAPRLLGLPVLPAHVAQRLLCDPGVPPGALGAKGPSGWEEGDQPGEVGAGKEGG